MSNQDQGHPKGLYLLFFTEMWERFSYYGMRAILMLYMTKKLLFESSTASGIYGNFTGLVYLTPLIGGYIADRYWGNRRSIEVGGLLMAIGQFTLFGSASFAADNPLSKTLFIVGLLTLIVGNGFFKPNISTMVNQLYAPGDKRVDSAFSIFYMGINAGAFLSPLICGALAENIDFKWGFFSAGCGMLLSLAVFLWLKDKYIVSADGVPLGGKPGLQPAPQAAVVENTQSDPNILDAPSSVVNAPKASNNVEVPSTASGTLSVTRILTWVVAYAALLFGFSYILAPLSTFIFATSIAASGFVITDPSLTAVERSRIIVIYIIAFFVLFFWAAFEQAGASLTLFADQQTDRMIFGWEMPASWFQSMNPAFIVIFAPIFAILWGFLSKRNAEPASPVKQAIGLFLLAVGYLIISFGVKGVEPGVKVSMLWLTCMYLVHTWGELCLSPIGLSMVARLSPLRLASLLMGIWFMSNAMANDFAGILSGLYPEGGVAKHFLFYEIANMYDFFMLFVVMAGVASVILYFLSSKLLQMMHGIR